MSYLDNVILKLEKPITVSSSGYPRFSLEPFIYSEIVYAQYGGSSIRDGYSNYKINPNNFSLELYSAPYKQTRVMYYNSSHTFIACLLDIDQIVLYLPTSSGLNRCRFNHNIPSDELVNIVVTFDKHNNSIKIYKDSILFTEIEYDFEIVIPGTRNLYENRHLKSTSYTLHHPFGFYNETLNYDDIKDLYRTNYYEVNGHYPVGPPKGQLALPNYSPEITELNITKECEFEFLVKDPNGDICDINIDYSIDGGDNYNPIPQNAIKYPGKNNIQRIENGILGSINPDVTCNFIWDSSLHISGNQEVIIKLVPYDGTLYGDPVYSPVLKVENELNAPKISYNEKTDNSFDLMWDSIENAEGYKIYKNDDLMKTISSDEFVNNNNRTNIKLNEKSTIKVKSFDSNKESTYSNSLELIPTPSNAYNINISNITENSALVEWDQDNPYSSFKIKITNNSTVIKSLTTSKRYIELDNLNNNTEYKFSIQTLYEGKQSDFIYENFTTKKSVDPKIISANVNNIDYTSAKLIWSSNEDVETVDIEISPGSKSLKNKTAKGNITVDGLSNNTKYTARIIPKRSHISGSNKAVSWKTKRLIMPSNIFKLYDTEDFANQQVLHEYQIYRAKYINSVLKSTRIANLRIITDKGFDNLEFNDYIKCYIELARPGWGTYKYNTTCKKETFSGGYNFLGSEYFNHYNKRVKVWFNEIVGPFNGLNGYDIFTGVSITDNNPYFYHTIYKDPIYNVNDNLIKTWNYNSNYIRWVPDHQYVYARITCYPYKDGVKGQKFETVRAYKFCSDGTNYYKHGGFNNAFPFTNYHTANL